MCTPTLTLYSSVSSKTYSSQVGDGVPRLRTEKIGEKNNHHYLKRLRN